MPSPIPQRHYCGNPRLPYHRRQWLRVAAGAAVVQFARKERHIDAARAHSAVERALSFCLLNASQSAASPAIYHPQVALISCHQISSPVYEACPYVLVYALSLQVSILVAMHDHYLV